MGAEPVYTVAFSEYQNSTQDKAQAFINKTPLDEDRVVKVYVKVKWVTKTEYDEYQAYVKNPAVLAPVREVVAITRNGRLKYAEKPEDNTYSLISKEIVDNMNNQKYNATRGVPEPGDRPLREIHDYDVSTFYIKWGDSPELTPIRWDIFYNLDADKVLTYYDNSISPDELVCLAEDSADFWTVTVPQPWPRAVGLQTMLKLKHYESIDEVTTLKNDAYVALLGAQAYSLWPITEQQDSPVPAVAMPPNIQQEMMRLANKFANEDDRQAAYGSIQEKINAMGLPIKT
jgi:hypothetical protein